MAKRPKVPAALHSELTEYSSLLRALRTSNTLDLAHHLTEPPPTAPRATLDPGDVPLPDDDEGANAEGPPLTESASRDLTSDFGSSERSRLTSDDRERLPSGKLKQRDTWTRWPLLAGDVHVPEWGIHEEVRHVARRVLVPASDRTHTCSLADAAEGKASGENATAASPAPGFSDSEGFEHPGLSSVALRALTSDAAAFLARVLALLAAHVPNAEKSMQNRLRPINWETVIDVACAHGVVTADAADRVRTRMARLYPPTQSSTAHRAKHLSTMRQSLADMLSPYDASLLGGEPLAIPHPPVRRRSAKKRAASADAGSSAKRQRSEDG